MDFIFNKIIHLIFFAVIGTVIINNFETLAKGKNRWASLSIDYVYAKACPSPWNALQIHNFKIKYITKNVQAVDADFNVSRTVQFMNHGVVNITKCSEAMSFNTCEHFMNWRYNGNTCAAIVMNGTLWRPLVDSTTPDLKCPLTNGTLYNMRNGTIDLGVIQSMPFPLTGNIWIFQITAFNEEDLPTYCFEFGVRFLRVRSG